MAIPELHPSAQRRLAEANHDFAASRRTATRNFYVNGLPTVCAELGAKYGGRAALLAAVPLFLTGHGHWEAIAAGVAVGSRVIAGLGNWAMRGVVSDLQRAGSEHDTRLKAIEDDFGLPDGTFERAQPGRWMIGAVAYESGATVTFPAKGET